MPGRPAIGRGATGHPCPRRISAAGSRSEAVSRAIRLGADAGTRVSIAPVSTAAAVEVIRRAKADGLAVTAEACPHADLCLVDLTARHCVDRAAVGINQPGRRQLWHRRQVTRMALPENTAGPDQRKSEGARSTR